MSTTTTTKKLFYQQDPDGVFRLKKVNQNLSPVQNHSLQNNHKDKSVDDYINELSACSFQLQDGTSRTNPQPSSKANFQKHSPSSSIVSSDSRTTVSTSDTKKNTSNSLKVDLSSLNFQSIFPSLMSFHVPSFLAGVIATLFCTVFRFQLLHAAKVAASFFIIVLALVIIVAGIAWHKGMISPQELISNVSKLFQSDFPEKLQKPPRKESVVQDPHDVASADEYNNDEESIDSQDMGPTDMYKELLSQPKSHTDQYESVYVQPFVPTTRTGLYKSQSKDKIPQSRRGSKLYQNVHASTPELITGQKHPNLLRSSTDTRLRTDTRRSIDGSLPLPDLSASPTRALRHPSPTREFPKILKVHSATSKELPPSPGENHELPLINPLSLKSMEEEGPVGLGITRSDTILTNKSVLGTRVNYKKFLANVEGN